MSTVQIDGFDVFKDFRHYHTREEHEERSSSVSCPSSEECRDKQLLKLTIARGNVPLPAPPQVDGEQSSGCSKIGGLQQNGDFKGERCKMV
jgi:hypothetical protein